MVIAEAPPRRAPVAVPHPKRNWPPFDCVALVLQGGGALGSYQAGVYEALAERGLHPDWVAGISIGAINAAIIAGNAPDERVARLKGFWETITANHLLDWAATHPQFAPQGEVARGLFNRMSATLTALFGAPGFFEPRYPAPWWQPDGSMQATSFYSAERLKNTLERFVDFDRINAGETRFSAGAVNVRTGNFVYFDNEHREIRAEHVMASGSLPPSFPATEIDGEFYWDGGLVSNTPLQWVVDAEVRKDTLAFQVDLWPAEGPLPRNLAEVMTRQKEIQYSSRTRAGTDQFARVQRVRGALADLLAKLPKELRNAEETEVLREVAGHNVYNIVQLIYRSKKYERHSKDYEFSRLTMQDHWRAGYQDASTSLRHREVLERPAHRDGVFTFDFLKEEQRPSRASIPTIVRKGQRPPSRKSR